MNDYRMRHKNESSHIPNLNISDHDHEEADSLIAYHCLHAASCNPGCKINVHSVDTDVETKCKSTGKEEVLSTFRITHLYRGR